MSHTYAPHTAPTRPASGPALKFATDLLDNRDLHAHAQIFDKTNAMDAGEFAAYIQGLKDRCAVDAEYCSRMIDELKPLPRKGARPSTPAREAAPLPNGAHPDLSTVVDDLAARERAGRLNDFGESLLDQWRRRGTLTDRQVEAYMKGLAKRTPREQQTLPGADALPAGRYAVDSADGELTFYRINRSKDGAKCWIHLQHGPSESEVPFTWAGYRTILQSIIDAGPAECAVRYGREIGSCSQCGLRLTNRLSRWLGIGPVCGGHLHDAAEWRVIRREARHAIKDLGFDPDENVEDDSWIPVQFASTVDPENSL